MPPSNWQPRAFALLLLLIFALVVGNITVSPESSIEYEPGLKPEVKSEATEVTPSPTPTPTPTPAPASKVEGTTKTAPKPVDTDPIVNCKSKYGGSIEVRRSECKQMVDCQIGDTWVIMKRDGCEKAQVTEKSDTAPPVAKEVEICGNCQYSCSIPDLNVDYRLETIRIHSRELELCRSIRNECIEDCKEQGFDCSVCGDCVIWEDALETDILNLYAYCEGSPLMDEVNELSPR